MDNEERELRQKLSEKLGVEFCSEEELSNEIDAAKVEKVEREQARAVRAVGNPDPDMVPVTVGAIFERLRDMHTRLQKSIQRNRGKSSMQQKQRKRLMHDAATLRLAATALSQVVNRLGKAEAQLGGVESKDDDGAGGTAGGMVQ